MYEVTWSFDHSFNCTSGHEHLLIDKESRNEVVVTTDKLYVRKECTFPVSGTGTGDDSKLSSFERLLIAIKADGSLIHTSKSGIYTYRLQFSKDRKKERCLELLEKSGVTFTEVLYSNRRLRGWHVKLDREVTKLLKDDFGVEMGVN